MGNDNLISKARNLPQAPGCYIMKKKHGEKFQVLYIGKAKNLRSRVSSYFRLSAKDVKTEILVGHITDFEFITTANETEALVLENNLIKKYSPKYNIRLKDDKSYPYIVVDLTEPFPRPIYTRKLSRKKGIKVYGPFVFGGQISEVLKILVKSFKLRDCSLREFKNAKVACLLYQIEQCSAPCVEYIDNETYEKNLQLALSVLEGKEKKALEYLEKMMEDFALSEKFEMAAVVRDNIEVLREFSRLGKQKNVELDDNQKNVDIIACYKGEEEVEVSIYMIRSGLLLGHKNLNFYLKDLKDTLDDEFTSYLYRYYEQLSGSYPDHIVLEMPKDKIKILNQALNELLNSSIEMRLPGRKFSSLYELTKTDAKLHQEARLKSFGSSYNGLLKLTELLNLKERPIVLECYDIAIFSGASPTAAQIVYHNGLPDKKSYRHYKLKELPEGNNDFAMMREVLTRRIPHGNLPDVFIVDGGVLQVNIFIEVLKEFKLAIPVVGLAKARTLSGHLSFKDKNISKTDERLIIPGRSNPYILSKNMSLFQILTSMRDEAHRFSRRLHHKLESKRIVKSDLDNIPGIGPKIKQKILKNLTMSLQAIGQLTALEIEKNLDVSQKHALLIKKYFEMTKK